jgi:hypothetical protein
MCTIIAFIPMMKRRILLKTLTTGMILGVSGAWLGLAGRDPREPPGPTTVSPGEGLLPTHDPEGPAGHSTSQADKVRHFDQDYADDYRLPKAQWPVLLSTLARMKRVRRLVGHANFSLLGFDAMLRYARNYPAIGEFSQAECAFMEEMFGTDARRYGFLGDKVLPRLTSRIDRKAVIKVPRSGNYLFQGQSLQMYSRLRKDVGPDLILTSGIRSVVKQLFLFLAKLEATAGNLSRASRSLAPPGHSYHGIGDFDVGRADLGAANFTARFASTPEFRKLRSLGYVAIRYTPDNRVGVRFEPWHIKVV